MGAGATTAVGNITVGIMVIKVDIMGHMANINLHLLSFIRGGNYESFCCNEYIIAPGDATSAEAVVTL